MRWCVWFVVCLLWMGCGSTYQSNTYTYYELIHSPQQLKVGDRVKIETKDEVIIEGAIIRMNEDGLVISHEGEGNQRLWWDDVHVMHKVMTTTTQKE